MKINAKQFFFVMIALTVLSFGGIVGAFYWGEKQLQSKADTIANLQTDRDVAYDKILALHRAQQSAELADQATALLSTLLPAQKQQEALLADVIYTASAEAGIPLANLGAITFASGNEPSDLSGTEQLKEIPGVYTYPFNMSVQNINYDTLLKLLQEIENNGRLVQVDDLQISPDKSAPGQISSVNLSLKAFLKP